LIVSTRSFTLIVPAAGSGSRLGSEVAKPYIKVGGQTLLEHALAPFLKLDELKEIIIVTSGPYRAQAESILESLNIALSLHVVAGGRERQQSIMNALTIADKSIPFIAVHDAVRPFVTADQIRQCLKRATSSRAAILAVPVRDTIKTVDESGSQIVNTPDRRLLWQAQTPQIFEADLLRQAYQKAVKNRFEGTDDSSLVERMGVDVHLVEGSHQNMKITYPEDLELAAIKLSGGSAMDRDERRR
jgi:2-C-methyl-D-erythritol 4-phosphate cytidylyltransferase